MKRLLKGLAALAIGLTVTAGAHAGEHGSPSSRSSGSPMSHYGSSFGTHSSSSWSRYHDSHYGSGYGSPSYHQHYFSKHFDYGKYGKSSLHWSHYHWNKDWNCYFYYCPNDFCWYFWVPTYRSYVPVEYITVVQTRAPVAAPAAVPLVNVVQTTSANTATPAAIPPAPSVLPPAGN